MYVFLTGPPGAGKSAIAPLLARELGAAHLDLDTLIERRAKKPIARVFEEDGEPRFRQHEREALAALPDTPAWFVVATGGGAVVDPANRARMRDLGVIVGLRGRLHTLVERTREGDRPLLKGDHPSRLRALVESRREAYADADVRMATDGRAPEELALELAAALVAGRGVTIRVGESRGYDLAAKQREVAGRARGEAALAGYPVHVRAGALWDVGRMAREAGIGERVALVTDPVVGRRYGAAVFDALRRAGIRPTVVRVPAGETAKTAEILARLWRALARAELARDDGIVALGGGSVTDLAGFAAATYARGIAWIAIPTTLLGMVDAAIGGKTAIDLPEGKNLAGAFHDPRAVVADVSLFATLPERERRSGLAEVVKSAVLSDDRFLAQIERSARALGDGAEAPLFAAVVGAAQVKAAVVAADPRERGPRMLLNLGHTFGHALEAATRYRRYAHGEAVALGMVFACAVAEALGLCRPGLRRRLEAVLAEIGLPVRCRIPVGAWDALRLDKKRRGERLRWVLPRRVGDVTVVDDVPAAALRRAARVLESRRVT